MTTTAKHTPGTWRATDSGNGILSGPTWVVHNAPKGEHGTVIDNPADRLLIAAAPTLLREIQETRQRINELLKIERYAKDPDLSIALATIEMDLNRAEAIADGSWPSAGPVSSERR